METHYLFERIAFQAKYFVTDSRSKDQSGRQTEDVHNHWFFLRPIDKSMNKRTNHFDYVIYVVLLVSFMNKKNGNHKGFFFFLKKGKNLVN